MSNGSAVGELTDTHIPTDGTDFIPSITHAEGKKWDQIPKINTKITIAPSLDKG